MTILEVADSRRPAGDGAMRVNEAEFVRLVAAVLQRFFRQNGREGPADAETVATRLAQLVSERSLPRPLGPSECGAPGSMPEAECAPLVARVVGDTTDLLLADAVRQLVKACFYPEFTVCRDSFREVARDGSCRRQELARVRGRVSGTHCVDCPHWVGLAPMEHAAMLEMEWKRGGAEFAAERDVFLPEDFRALRRWLHTAARHRS